MTVQRMPPARAKVNKRPFWIQFIVVSPESLGCQWAAMPVRWKRCWPMNSERWLKGQLSLSWIQPPTTGKACNRVPLLSKKMKQKK